MIQAIEARVPAHTREEQRIMRQRIPQRDLQQSHHLFRGRGHAPTDLPECPSCKSLVVEWLLVFVWVSVDNLNCLL